MSTKPKVICVGLGRTGTMSLAEALDILGFGPTYHTLPRVQDTYDMKIWFNIGQGSDTAQDDLKTLLKDYNSVLDYPVAINFDKLYKLYPDAKFILTTRDPAKWEASMKATLLKSRNDAPLSMDPDSPMDWMSKWFAVDMLARYHQGKLHTDTQNELIAHNKRVVDTIPADQLLIYEISQGWEPLAKFLEVEEPDIPFPHANDNVKFEERVAELLLKSQNKMNP